MKSFPYPAVVALIRAVLRSVNTHYVLLVLTTLFVADLRHRRKTWSHTLDPHNPVGPTWCCYATIGFSLVLWVGVLEEHRAAYHVASTFGPSRNLHQIGWEVVLRIYGRLVALLSIGNRVSGPWVSEGEFPASWAHQRPTLLIPARRNPQFYLPIQCTINMGYWVLVTCILIFCKWVPTCEQSCSNAPMPPEHLR